MDILAAIKRMCLKVPLIPEIDHADDQSLKWKGYVSILILILAFSVGAQWFYYFPKLNTDAQVWINIAKNLGDSADLAYAPFYYERIFFTGFLALVGALVPLSADGILPLVLALSALTILLVAEITRVAVGRLAALVAATLFACHPVILTFGSFLVSDTLALPLSLSVLLLITRYIRDGKFHSIAIAALLGGACFFVKSYTVVFGIAAVAVFIAIWFMTGAGSWWKLLVLVGLLILPIVVGHLFHWAFYGDPFFYANYYENYASRVYGDSGLILSDVFSSAGLKIILERFEYISYFFTSSGVFAGAWSIFTMTFLLFRFRVSFFHSMLSAGFFCLLLFLMFAPVRLAPLVFVEIQTRYLTLPIALLAIGGGLALASFQNVLGAKWRKDMILASVLFVISSFYTPNFTSDDYFHRYRVLDYYAVESAIQSASDTEVLLLPFRYRDMFLEELLQPGLPINFVDMNYTVASDELFTDQLKCNCAVFIPRRQYPVLADNLRIQELRDISEYGGFEAYVEKLEAEGFHRSPLTVPYSPLRMLGADIGVKTKGELVGWLFRRPG